MYSYWRRYEPCRFAPPEMVSGKLFKYLIVTRKRKNTVYKYVTISKSITYILKFPNNTFQKINGILLTVTV